MLESVLNKFADLKANNFFKKRLQHRCFPVNFAKFLKNISWRLLLKQAQHVTWQKFLVNDSYFPRLLWKIILQNANGKSHYKITMHNIIAYQVIISIKTLLLNELGNVLCCSSSLTTFQESKNQKNSKSFPTDSPQIEIIYI